MRIQVAFINKSTVVTDAELTPIVTALQKQVDHDFRPTWGVAAALVQVPKGGEIPLNHAWIGIFDDSDQAGALGYHDLTPQGFPAGKDETLSFRGHVTEPFSLAAGGYASYVDLRNLGAGWQQVDAAEAGVPGQRPVGFPPGSRRARRARVWDNDVQVSEPA
jgi:hypothetical protein